MRLNPAEYVLLHFDGVRDAARKLNYSPSAVSRWRKTGQIPIKARKKILAYTKKRDIKTITPYELELGGRATVMPID